MNIRMTRGRNALGSAAVLAALTVTATLAAAAEIRVVSGGAPREALAVLTPAFEKRTGHTVMYKIAVPTAQSLDAGEKTDMVLMPVPVIDAFVKAGKMRAEGRAVMGLLGSSVVVKQGAVQPDISTPDSFRKTLLDARSVADAKSEGLVKAAIERAGIRGAVVAPPE